MRGVTPHEPLQYRHCTLNPQSRPPPTPLPPTWRVRELRCPVLVEVLKRPHAHGLAVVAKRHRRLLIDEGPLPHDAVRIGGAARIPQLAAVGRKRQAARRAQPRVAWRRAECVGAALQRRAAAAECGGSSAAGAPQLAAVCLGELPAYAHDLGVGGEGEVLGELVELLVAGVGNDAFGHT